MFNKLKQVKDLRDKAKQIHSVLSAEKVEGAALWGKVKVSMDGNQSVLAVSIDEDIMKNTEKVKLEEALKEAFNDAIKKAQRKMIEKMKENSNFDMSGLS